MQRIARKDAMNYEFNKALPPSIKVDEHEEFIVETEDALSGKVRSEKDLPIAETFGELLTSNPVKTNPVTNPIYVNGAEPGDVLAVEIVDIILAYVEGLPIPSSSSFLTKLASEYLGGGCVKCCSSKKDSIFIGPFFTSGSISSSSSELRFL